jgi:SAM-dependent methyltransferase
MPVQRNKAIVGANAFAHESGIHQHGMLRHRGTYEIMRPEDVGWEDSQMVLGRHSGRAAVEARLRALGFWLDEDELKLVFEQFKGLCEQQRVVTDADLQTLMQGGSNAQGYRLASMTISDVGSRANALVELSDPDGNRVAETAQGDGPVDALFGALSAATGVQLMLDSYHVHSVGIGADARGEANLSVRHEGVEYDGTGTSKDIIEASALAWLDVANRLLRQRQAAAHSSTDVPTPPPPEEPAMSAFDTPTPASAAGQQWNAQDYAIDAGFVPLLGGAVSRLLDPRAGERILDLGCGDGVLSTELALSGAHPRRGCLAGTGDRRPCARCRRAGDGRPRAVVRQRVRCGVQQCGTALDDDPDRVLEGVRRALRPGGRFVAEFGGHGNVATIIAAVQAARVAHGHGASTFQWYFPTADAYADRLRQHGFQVQLIECTPRPTALPTGVAGWLRVFAAPLLDDLPAEARATVREAATALLAELPRNAAGQPLADYVRLRVLARRR